VAELAGKVALVTGVGRAGQIGDAVAAGLGVAGARLVIVDRDAGAVEERARELESRGVRARAVAGDLTTPEAARAAVAEAHREYGGLDIVVNVAGGLFRHGSFLELPPEELDPVLAVNLKTTAYMCQAAIPAMIERGGGAIINFASIAVVRPAGHMAFYAAAKAAVAGLTQALAQEFAPRGIRVNAVAPATVRTGVNAAELGLDAEMVDLGDLVRAVRFLASDAARAVTGVVMPLGVRGS
jgi:NAD(P)-dependent dehydrogenase (short-subunit alcohol dehydrogenase family)